MAVWKLRFKAGEKWHQVFLGLGWLFVFVL